MCAHEIQRLHSATSPKSLSPLLLDPDISTAAEQKHRSYGNVGESLLVPPSLPDDLAPLKMGQGRLDHVHDSLLHKVAVLVVALSLGRLENGVGMAVDGCDVGSVSSL